MTVCPDPSGLAAQLSALFGIEADAQEIALESGFRLSFLSAGAYAARFGDLAAATDRDAFFGALGLRAANPDALNGALEACGDRVSVARAQDCAVVALASVQTLIRFDF